MRIGIVEVCESNHYTAVLALAQTYLVGANNAVTIFTTDAIRPLFEDISNDVSFVIKEADTPIQAFLEEISVAKLDRIHINTISKYYKEFASTNWLGEIYFTIHNVDLWYDNSLLKRVKTLIFDYKALLSSKIDRDIKFPLVLFLKSFKRQHYREAFIEKISRKSFKIIVYSESQKRHLQNFVSAENILVFPFCLHNGYIDKSGEQDFFRICIPGSVSNERRDYTQFFQMLRNNLCTLKNELVVDLLGYIPADHRFLLEEILSLQREGFNVVFNEGFITATEFDQRLAASDIIIGNLKVQAGASSRYGETKETGIIFNIIKSGKPGIMPAGYPLDQYLEPACLFFNDYQHLAKLILSLSDDTAKLEDLKERARVSVQHYTPDNLYHLLEA